MKVMTVVGTRPEIIKLSRVIPELDKHFDHVLVHLGQNWDYELGGIFFEQMGIRKPNEWHPHIAPSVGELLQAAESSLDFHKSDAVLILGDTNSGVAAAYAAKRRHIPLFHMEAGNRCFDDRVPEETNRKIIDHISDINMPYTEHARRNLLAEGLPADRVIKTGSPMMEVLHHYKRGIQSSQVLEFFSLDYKEYYVVSAHREENVDDPPRLEALVETINSLPGPVVFSVHPRTRDRLASAFTFAPTVQLIKPLGFFDYCQLQKHAKCVISDSGTLTEEAAILGFPGVMIRQAHERPEGMDEGVVVMADLAPASVMAAVNAVTTAKPGFPPDYGTIDVARKVVWAILSYTDYVQRAVYGR